MELSYNNIKYFTLMQIVNKINEKLTNFKYQMPQETIK